MTTRAAGGLDQFTEAVRERIADAPVAGFDETGLRVAGALHWVHCARTDKYTPITCHPKRGRHGIDDNGVLARFNGVAVHDAWAPYDQLRNAEGKARFVGLPSAPAAAVEAGSGAPQDTHLYMRDT
ncbi:IS66 family transposase [Mycobacterium sp. HUMS_1102779]